jgi:hypothetical protein
LGVFSFKDLSSTSIHLSKEGGVFKNDKIFIVENKSCVRLEDESGKVVALIFINSDGLIIRGDVNVIESSIEAPIIKKI